MNKPISEFNEDLIAFRRLSPRVQAEQLVLPIDCESDFDRSGRELIYCVNQFVRVMDEVDKAFNRPKKNKDK